MPESKPNAMRPLVAQAIERARRRQKRDTDLIALIRPLVGRTYSDAAVSAWANGHSNMPADVLLAVAKVTNLSLDDLLFGESMAARLDRLEDQVQELRSRLDKFSGRDLAPHARPRASRG